MRNKSDQRVKGGVVCLAGFIAGLALQAEELSWEATWDASERPVEVTSRAAANGIQLDAIVSVDQTSLAQGLDAVLYDLECSQEGALDTRPPTGLWFIFR